MPDYKTSDFNFDLPLDLIAQQAVEPRDSARLLHIKPDATQDLHVFDLPTLLRPGDLLVMNDTRVIPARLYGMRGVVKVEVLLHKRHSANEWLAFARPGKRLKQGDSIVFADGFSAQVMEKHEGGEILIRFDAADAELFALLHKYGEPPLPPYIKREPGTAKADEERYQTVYAKRDGAVAAPTAGLHFTPELLQKLDAMGVERAIVTLHVGAGTFLPVKVENIAEHVMHAEWGEITPQTAEQITKAKREGRRVISVGTTSLRVTESAADENGTVHPFAQETSIFITPGYRFKAIDALMTNFHLPESTLFMLVSAFMGLDRMKAAYAHAIAQKYRFYSFGDASFLERPRP